MRFFRNLYRASIWAPDSIPLDEAKYAVPLKRYILPVFDILMVIGGVFAIHSGMPSFEALIRPWAFGLAYMVTIAAGTALLGIAFPGLWRLEIVGKILLFVLLGMYAIALFLRGNSYTGVTYLGLSLLPLLRLWIIGWEFAERRDADGDGRA